MRSTNLFFISLLMYSTFSYISSMKTNLVSKGFMSIEQPKLKSTATTTATISEYETCSKLADYLKAWDLFNIDLDILIKQFQKHVELYKSWQSQAFSTEDREELKEKEKHILKTYIEELLKVDKLYKQAIEKHNQYKAQKCDKKLPNPDLIPDDDKKVEGTDKKEEKKEPEQKKKEKESSEKDSTTLAQITNLTKMLTLRMRELNMKVNNPAFMELSREVLPKDF